MAHHYAKALGRKGGRVKSERKAAAARQNGTLAQQPGRPPVGMSAAEWQAFRAKAAPRDPRQVARELLLAFLALVLLVLATGCSKSPLSPDPLPTNQPTLVPVAVHVVPSPSSLPTGGGSSTIRLEVVGAGLAPIRDARIQLDASSGSLDAAEIVTDATGHASVTWQGDRSGTIVARVGDVAGSSAIAVETTAPVPPPSTPPTIPIPAPEPVPPFVGFTVSATSIVTGEAVTFGVSGNAVSQTWDFNADGIVDSTAATVTHTFCLAGVRTVVFSAVRADGTTTGDRIAITVTDPLAGPPASCSGI